MRVPLQSMSPLRKTQDWSGSRGALAAEGQAAAAPPGLSAREASCLCDTLVRLYHLSMVGAFRHVLYYQQSGTQALQHHDELQQRLPVSPLLRPVRHCWRVRVQRSLVIAGA